MFYDVVEGLTSPLVFQLQEHGAPIDLSNISILPIINDKDGITVTLASTFNYAITDAPNGKVSLTPIAVNSFLASRGPYYIRWKLTNLLTQGADSVDDISYVPSSNRDIININGV